MMKQKSKIVLATIIAVLSLTMITTIPSHDLSTETTDRLRDITPHVSQMGVTPPPIEPQISQTLPTENEQSSTQIELITKANTKPPIEEVTPIETALTQPTEKERLNITPTEDTQTPTKPTAPPPAEPSAPKNGDMRFIDGKQQSYLLGFGWVDYMGENEVVYCEDMYENGNKVGIMD